MISNLKKINFVSILNDTSLLVKFPHPIINKTYSREDFIDEDLQEEHLLDAIVYFIDEVDFKADSCYRKIGKYFPDTPIIQVGNLSTDLVPRLNIGTPFLTININDLSSDRIVSLLSCMPQFKEVMRLVGILKDDVDATKLIADLNIERLHKTLKELELERQKTEQVNKSKQLFMAGITHELRTPLTAIHGFADLFSFNNLNNEQKRSIGIIKEASSNLLNIVNDLLNYSKITEGKLSIFNEPFSLKTSVQRVYELLKPKADEKGLNFQLNFKLKEDVRVLGDRFRLKQVLINLLSNAIKFTEKGYVELSVDELLGDNLVFVIKDTGVGIKEDKLKDIFESYVQAEESTSQEYGGTGLGLAIVKELIQIQGGSISVKSELNKGSEFSFQLSLPVVKDKLNIEDTEDASKIDLSNLSVLAVEDNHLNQLLIQKLLFGKVKMLQIAGDGLKALNIANTVKFDVILMDLNLPKMSGMEVVSEIRKKGINSATPIAVITANIWEEELDLIKKHGIDTIIQKPFNRKDLYFQINNLCNGKQGELIGLNYLREISGGDLIFIVDVLTTYQSNILIDLQKLMSAVSDNQGADAKTIAHKMRSSFKMLEMHVACEICEEIEFNESNIPSNNLVKDLKLIIDKSILEAKGLIKRYSI